MPFLRLLWQDLYCFLLSLWKVLVLIVVEGPRICLKDHSKSSCYQLEIQLGLLILSGPSWRFLQPCYSIVSSVDIHGFPSRSLNFHCVTSGLLFAFTELQNFCWSSPNFPLTPFPPIPSSTVLTAILFPSLYQLWIKSINFPYRWKLLPLASSFWLQSPFP